MAVVGGLLVRLQIDGIEYDPVGDWEIATSFIKKEVDSTTYKQTNIIQTPVSGMISGQIKASRTIDLERIREAVNVNVLAESASGRIYEGIMTYTGENKIEEGTGSYPISLEGTLRQTI